MAQHISKRLHRVRNSTSQKDREKTNLVLKVRKGSVFISYQNCIERPKIGETWILPTFYWGVFTKNRGSNGYGNEQYI